MFAIWQLTHGAQIHDATASPQSPPLMLYLDLAFPLRMVRAMQGQKQESVANRQPDSPRPFAFWHTRHVGQKEPITPGTNYVRIYIFTTQLSQHQRGDRKQGSWRDRVVGSRVVAGN